MRVFFRAVTALTVPGLEVPTESVALAVPPSVAAGVVAPRVISLLAGATLVRAMSSTMSSGSLAVIWRVTEEVPSTADRVAPQVTATGSSSPPHGSSGDAVFCGDGAPTVKSLALWSVSTQPSVRAAEVVLDKVAVGAVSEQLVVVP